MAPIAVSLILAKTDRAKREWRLKKLGASPLHVDINNALTKTMVTAASFLLLPLFLSVHC